MQPEKLNSLLRKNQKGMSLVQIMVGFALAGVLSVVMMNLMEQQNKQQKKALLSVEETEIFSQFVRVIGQRESCDATFTAFAKGQDLKEFRYSFDPNKEPFAVVGEKFRGTKLILEEIHILTDAEYMAKHEKTEGPIKSGTGAVVLSVRITLKRPAGTLGAPVVQKYFDLPVAMGKGEIIKMDSIEAVKTECLNTTDNLGCIANLDTGVCDPNQNDWDDDIEYGYYGYCLDPEPPSPQDEIITHCTGA